MARFFYPHNVDDGLELRATRFVDVNSERELRFAAREIGDGAVRQAYEVGNSDWQRIKVFFKLKNGSNDVKSLLQPGEDEEQALRPVLSVRCRKTNLRFVAPVLRSEAGWLAETIIDRRLVRHVVTIRPLLIRTAPAVARSRSGRANVAGAILGEGPAVQFVVDASANPFAGGLDVRWEDFRASMDSWRRSHDADLYAVSFEPEPTVWLNAKHQKLHAILHDDTSSGTAALIRQALFSYIKEGIWSSLFRAATSSITRDPETGTVLDPDGWQSVVMDSLLPKIYPEAGGKEKQLEALADALTDPDAGAGLEARLRSAVQAVSNSTKSMNRIVRIAEEP